MNPRSTIRELERKLAQLDERRQSLLQQIECLDIKRDSLKGVIALFEADLDITSEPQVTSHSHSSPASQPKEARNQMVDILRSLRHPVYYKDFVDLLRERGVTVNGVDPARTISAHLSNDDRFVKVGRGLWALNSWPESMKRVPEPDVPHKEAALEELTSRAGTETNEPHPEPVPLFGVERPSLHQRIHTSINARDDDEVRSM